MSTLRGFQFVSTTALAVTLACTQPTIVDSASVHTIASDKQSVLDFINKAHHAINEGEFIERLERSEITLLSKKATRSQERWFVISNLGNKYTFKLQISRYNWNGGPIFRYEILGSQGGWAN